MYLLLVGTGIGRRSLRSTLARRRSLRRSLVPCPCQGCPRHDPTTWCIAGQPGCWAGPILSMAGEAPGSRVVKVFARSEPEPESEREPEPAPESQSEPQPQPQPEPEPEPEPDSEEEFDGFQLGSVRCRAATEGPLPDMELFGGWRIDNDYRGPHIPPCKPASWLCCQYYCLIHCLCAPCTYYFRKKARIANVTAASKSP